MSERTRVDSIHREPTDLAATRRIAEALEIEMDEVAGEILFTWDGTTEGPFTETEAAAYVDGLDRKRDIMYDAGASTFQGWADSVGLDASKAFPRVLSSVMVLAFALM